MGVDDASILIPVMLDCFKLESKQLALFEFAMKSKFTKVAMKLPPLGNVVEFVCPLTKV